MKIIFVRCADTVTYNSMITAAENNQRTDLAEAAYQAALKARCANTVTYANRIEALVLNKQEEKETKLFITTYQESIPALKKKKKNTFAIDLHEQNSSTTMLIMKHHYNKDNICAHPGTAFRIELIVGKGIHSKKKERSPPVARAIYNLQHESFWKDMRYAPQIFEHEENQGRLLLFVEPNSLNVYIPIVNEDAPFLEVNAIKC